MRNHGKGRSISINEPNQGGTSTVNAWKSTLATVPEAPMSAWRPLTTWPFVSHPHQADIDAYRAMPSRWHEN